MKNFIFVIIAFATFFVANVSYAQANCDNLVVTGMNSEQIIKLKQQCLEINQSPVSAAESALQIAEYAELGQKYGIAISEVAKSIGTTVNELAFTPVGLFMLAIVGWKIIGSDLMGIVGGTIWFMVMLPIWWTMMNRFVFSRINRIEETFQDGKLVARNKKPIEFNDSTGIMTFVLILVLIAICIAGIVMVF